MKLLVVALDGYQDIELVSYVSAVKMSNKFEEIIIWNPDKKNQVEGSNKIGYINSIEEYNLEDIDAIFIPGGKSCLSLRTHEIALNVIKKFEKENKFMIAICDAPNALIENKIHLDKKYTSYPIHNIDNVSTNLRIGSEEIVIDGNYITGRAPTSSLLLAKATIDVIFSDEKNAGDVLWKMLSGN